VNILKAYYSHKLENLDEMDKFLDVYDEPKLNEHDLNSLNFITHCL
jgi:hypothetical protein